VTDGAQGVKSFEDNRVLNIPAFPFEALDKLGAGDVLYTAMVRELARQLTEHNAYVFAKSSGITRMFLCGVY